MKQWGILYRKEMLEMARTYKWIWVPLVFILLGIMQPVSMYYLPQILQHAGNLPEGTIFEMPAVSGGEVLAQTLGQYGTVGVLIIVLAMMSIISGERANGIASMILVKPVSYISYITSKCAAMFTLMTLAFLPGYAATWYYTWQLIGKVTMRQLAGSFALYWLWLLFIVTLTLLFSALLNSSGAIAFMTLGSVIFISLLTSLLPKWMTWSPAILSNQAAQYAMGGNSSVTLFLPIIMTILLIAICNVLAVTLVRRKELPE